MDWQGRTKEQVEYSNKVVAISVIGLTLLLGINFLVGLFV